MLLLAAVSPALAVPADAPEYPKPNSLIGVSVGYPWLVGGRAEAWLADQVSGELGAGTLGHVEDVGFDWALRWRPDFACFGCGGRVLVTLGLGIGGLVVPDLALKDPWEFAVGPDLSASVVYWFTPAVGVHLTARGGIGPGWVGQDLTVLDAQPWAFLTAGLAF